VKIAIAVAIVACRNIQICMEFVLVQTANAINQLLLIAIMNVKLVNNYEAASALVLK